MAESGVEAEEERFTVDMVCGWSGGITSFQSWGWGMGACRGWYIEETSWRSPGLPRG